MSLGKPNYYSRQDRELYDKLFYHNNNGVPLTEQENRFCITMYHMEEYDTGYGGDDAI